MMPSTQARHSPAECFSQGFQENKLVQSQVEQLARYAQGFLIRLTS